MEIFLGVIISHLLSHMSVSHTWQIKGHPSQLRARPGCASTLVLKHHNSDWKLWEEVL